MDPTQLSGTVAIVGTGGAAVGRGTAGTVPATVPGASRDTAPGRNCARVAG
ncbi:hypothetical protein [Pseudonocardia phyllosphaerae]|uniref:hypothetical protein n=1 Tax=Pseudonocardia phyllosphaerae TaxID=3390502 RepID=UPI00397C4A15